MDEKLFLNSFENKLLRAADVAKILNISRAFAYRLMQQGQIRTVCFARARRVRLEDLLDFIYKNLSAS